MLDSARIENTVFFFNISQVFDNRLRNHHLTTFKDSVFPPSHQELKQAKRAQEKKLFKSWKTAVCVVDTMKRWIDAAKRKDEKDRLRQQQQQEEEQYQ